MAALMKFDTLSWAKKLEKAGVPLQQAEVQVELIFRAMNDNTCTKQDLRETEGSVHIKLKELELKIESIKADLELKIESVRREVVEVRKDLMVAIEKLDASVSKEIAKWVLGVSAVQVTVILFVVRFMH